MLSLNCNVNGTSYSEVPVTSWGGMRHNLKVAKSRNGDSIDVQIVPNHHPKDLRSLLLVYDGMNLGYVRAKYKDRLSLYQDVEAVQTRNWSNARTVATGTLVDAVTPDPQMELPMAAPSLKVVGSVEVRLSSEPQTVRHEYIVHRLTWLKPNPEKGPYTPDWRGYLMVSGTYTDPNGKVVPFTDKQVTLVERVPGIIECREHDTSNSDYADQCNLLPVGGKKPFLAMSREIVKGRLVRERGQLPVFNGLFYHVPMKANVKVSVAIVPRNPEMPPDEDPKHVSAMFKDWIDEHRGEGNLASGMFRNQEETI